VSATRRCKRRARTSEENEDKEEEGEEEEEIDLWRKEIPRSSWWRMLSTSSMVMKLSE
jgi:hypothetical protein